MTAAITTLAMVTIATAMATVAEPMSVLDRPPPTRRELYQLELFINARSGLMQSGLRYLGLGT